MNTPATNAASLFGRTSIRIDIKPPISIGMQAYVSIWKSSVSSPPEPLKPLMPAVPINRMLIDRDITPASTNITFVRDAMIIFSMESV